MAGSIPGRSHPCHASILGCSAGRTQQGTFICVLGPAFPCPGCSDLACQCGHGNHLQHPAKGNPGSSVTVGRVPGPVCQQGCGWRQNPAQASTQHREKSSLLCRSGLERRPCCRCWQLWCPREAGRDASAGCELQWESVPLCFLFLVLFPPIVLKYHTHKRAFQSQGWGGGVRKSCLKYLLKP